MAVTLYHHPDSHLPPSLLTSLSTLTYQPTLYLTPFSSHTQTIFTSYPLERLLHQGYKSIEYQRELLEVKALDAQHFDGIVSLDSVTNNTSKLNSTSPIVLILHGLAGGSQELYVKALLAGLLHEQPDWRLIAMNSRGCGSTPLHSTQFYCGAYTYDLKQVLEHIHKSYPQAKIMGVAFSLGANIMTKALGEQGDDTLFHAVVSISNPFDLAVGSEQLHSTWLGREMYSKALAKNILKLADKHYEQLQHDKRLKWDVIRRQAYLNDIDDHLTSQAFNYKDGAAYYKAATSAAYVPLIRRPFLAINALDDPIASAHAIPIKAIEANEWCAQIVTAKGGHSCAWYTGLYPIQHWVTQPVIMFLRAACETQR